MRATTSAQSAVWPSSTTGFAPVSSQRPRLAAAPACAPGRPGRRARPLRARRCPAWRPTASDASRSSSPSARGRERGEHRRREERARERHAAHLLHARRRCRPARGRGRRAPRARAAPVHPSSTICVPHVVGEAALVVDHRPHVARRAPRVEERRARRRAAASCSSLNVKSMRATRPPMKPDARVMVRSARWTSPTPPRTRRSATSCALARREPPEVPRRWGDDERRAAAATGQRPAIMRTLERRRAWQRRLNEGRWAAINWPEGVGRPRGHASAERHLLRGDGARTARRASTTPTASGRSAR